MPHQCSSPSSPSQLVAVVWAPNRSSSLLPLSCPGVTRCPTLRLDPESHAGPHQSSGLDDAAQSSRVSCFCSSTLGSSLTAEATLPRTLGGSKNQSPCIDLPDSALLPPGPPLLLWLAPSSPATRHRRCHTLVCAWALPFLGCFHHVCPAPLEKPSQNHQTQAGLPVTVIFPCH